MPASPSTTSPPTTGASVPTPVAPVEQMPVDGSAALFEWTAVHAAQAYRLQVAPDADFEDVLYTVETGPSTLLTLYEMLPDDGSRFYWRVQAETHRGWQPWSPIESFEALTDQHVQAHQPTRHPEAASPVTAGHSASNAHDDLVIQPPYLTGETSGGSVLFFLLLLFGSFTALLILLLYVNVQ